MACDISVLCAEDATPWAEFIQRKLTDDKYGCSVIVTTVSVENGPLQQSVVDQHRSAQVQVLIVSPDLVEPLAHIEAPELLPNFFELFPRQSKSVAVFCGCDQDDFKILDLISKHFKNLNKWGICSAGLGEEEVRDVLVTIIQVLEQDVNNGTDSGIPEDIYLIPPPPRSLSKQPFRVIPDRLLTVGEEMYIVFEEAVGTPVLIQLDGDPDTEIAGKEENTHVFSFTLPADWKTVDSCAHLTVFCGGNQFGSVTVQLESKLDSLNRLLKDVINPMELLSKALNINQYANEDYSALDLKLKQILQTNFPAGNFQTVFDVSSQTFALGRKSDKETPTVLHFAAKFGLKELCAELLTCPGAAQAFTVENIHGLLPHDIAAEEGHEDLAKFLTDYMHTGVPIAMVYNEMIASKKAERRSKTKQKVPRDEAPPPPCPGGNYADNVQGERTTQSIYMDMSRASSGASISTDSRSSSSSQNASPKLTSPEATPPVSPRQARTSHIISPHDSTYVTSHQAPLPHSTSTSTPPPTPHATPSKVPPLHTTRPKVKPRTDKASSSPNAVCESIAEEKEAIEKSRPHSDSDVSSTSSRESPVDSEDRVSVFETPAPFSPAPILSAKEISTVSMTNMSTKDKALRNILQSAADGTVSMDDAKLLVNNWNDQYRKSQSTFEGKWSAIKEFQNTTLEEKDDKTQASVKPRKSFLKFFKRKAKSTSELTVDKSNTRWSKKKLGRHGVTSMMPATSVTSEESEAEIRYTHEQSSSSSGFQRQNSIRVSRAIQDQDLDDMPAVPSRSVHHSCDGAVKTDRPVIPNKLPLIKSNITHQRLAKEISHSEASPRADHVTPGAVSPTNQRHVSGIIGLGTELSPRLPDPDHVPKFS